ncbi:hypothetical protein ENUP19_0242G0016 [Entamoeba nuttalli]|uniref:Uncharacterized protein n=2 Tax=Entamoeba nuttalli TaxID=412467 RepID=K2H676_ENTNP|nr:hypothetical protein ENU1_179660 [Entamoeba nuttalli P19]EKE37999.1 hypothetical protein ENU1_179660 [Entamoeba nuttalli P19]|eukprot:XP_008859666.1 hypothetical protein ENU1_179660 [Entamoeba nuttalli P19]
MNMKCNCLFCKEFSDSIKAQKRLAWTTLCRLVFLSIYQRTPVDFINVRDIFKFLSVHWDVLSHLEQMKKKNWKKSILDALNHSDYFESGMSQYHTNGYWRLTDKSLPNVKNRKNKENNVKISSPQIPLNPIKFEIDLLQDKTENKPPKRPQHVFDIPKEEKKSFFETTQNFTPFSSYYQKQSSYYPPCDPFYDEPRYPSYQYPLH